MKRDEIIIHFNNIDNTQSLTDYIHKKLAKSKYKEIEFTNVNLRKLHHTGTDKYEITLIFRKGNLNKALQVRGNDVYSLVDVVENKLSSQVDKVRVRRNKR